MGRLTLLLSCLTGLAWARPDPARTAVLVNSDRPEGLAIAQAFMARRGIPAANLVSLPLGSAETLGWPDYSAKLLGPLRAQLLAKGLLAGQPEAATDARGRAGFVPTAEARLRWLVLIHGVPLKIAPSGLKPLNAANPVKGDHASVDSELATLALPNLDPEGARPNPWFGHADAEGDGFIRTARLDGPTASATLEALRGAWTAEDQGLRGRAYVDLGGPYQEGDDWFRACIPLLDALGWPPDVESTREQFAPQARGDAPAWYLGWYSQRPTGKFGRPTTRLAPGAIALHLHSFSASTLRDPAAGWTPWLVQQGAGLTFGNVYEPYLSLTVRPERLLEALRDGMSAGEAAWFATPAVSWQGVILGDPFYQPFARPLEAPARANDPLADYALLRSLQKLPHPLAAPELRRLQDAADRSGRLALRLACAQAEQTAGVTRPWKDPADLGTEDGGLIAAAATFVEARFGPKTGQKLRSELAKRPEWAPPPPKTPEKAPPR
ncbi:MAG: hypothetical protein RL250_1522 [Verrucomicrobiota bacterium]